MNKVIESLLQVWHSGMQLVSGRPRHPQSQGLVERAHHTLQKKLAAEISRNNLTTPPWSDWLPDNLCEVDDLCQWVLDSRETIRKGTKLSTCGRRDITMSVKPDMKREGRGENHRVQRLQQSREGSRSLHAGR